MSEKNITFEEALEALEKSADMLRKDDLALEDAINIFEEGTKLYEKCESILGEAKQRIEVFSKE